MPPLYNLARQNLALALAIALFGAYNFVLNNQKPVKDPQAIMTKIAQAEQQALDTITYPTAFPEIVALSEAQGVMLVPFLAHNASTLSSTIPSSQFGLPPPTNHYRAFGWPTALTLLCTILQLLYSFQRT